MADWIDRTTKQLHKSVSPATMEARFGGSFRDGNGKAASNATHAMIARADHDMLQAEPEKYRVVNPDNTVSLVAAVDRPAIDQAETDAQHDRVVARLDRLVSLERALLKMQMAESNRHAAKINEILTTIGSATTAAEVLTGIRAIQPLPTRTLAQVRQAVRDEVGS